MKNFYKEESRKNWYREQSLTAEDLMLGCVQRIADSLEIMAKPHNDLIAERDLYKHQYEAEIAKKSALERSINSYKGTITRLKNERRF